MSKLSLQAQMKGWSDNRHLIPRRLETMKHRPHWTNTWCDTRAYRQQQALLARAMEGRVIGRFDSDNRSPTSAGSYSNPESSPLEALADRAPALRAKSGQPRGFAELTL
eukprot:3604245-Alexandrium_andersonii.AAC.2